MNAVKRCLALIAATLVVNACGGDPTAERAGADLSIRATPGAVWVRNNSSATVNIEAVDPLGGPAAGSWSVGAIVGPMTAVLDSNYQNTNTGTLGVKSRFVVTPTAEGEGSVEFTGTGGTITVPVRIAPDTSDFNVTFTSPTVAGDSVIVPLNAAVTLTTPPGIRFTSATTVRVVSGTLARDTALFRPINFSIAADSQTMTFTPGPMAFMADPVANHNQGQVRITGIASLSTPSLVSSARTSIRLITDRFDTAGANLVGNRLVLSNTTPAIGDQITVTLPPEYRFSPNTTVKHITDSVVTVGSPAQQIPTNGLDTASVVISVSADSGTLVYLPAPGARGKPRFTNIRVRNNAAAFALTARSAQSYSVPTILNIASTQPATAPENTAITITMPVGTKLRPSSQVRTDGAPNAAGATLLNAIVVSRAADSSAITVIPMPGFNKVLTVTALRDTRVPSLSLTLPTAAVVRTTATAGAAKDTIPSLGADDADADSASVGHVNMNLAVGETSGFWDRGTWSGSDWVGFGGPEQDVAVTLANAGNYTVTMDWDGVAASDVDFVLFNSTLTGLIGGFGAATGAHPEVITANFPAGTFFITAGVFAGANPKYLRITIKRNS